MRLFQVGERFVMSIESMVIGMRGVRSAYYLELLAAWFGLKCFAKELRDCDVLLRIDNTMAIAYIIKKGGVISKVDKNC